MHRTSFTRERWAEQVGFREDGLLFGAAVWSWGITVVDVVTGCSYRIYYMRTRAAERFPLHSFPAPTLR